MTKQYVIIMKTVQLTDSQMMRLDHSIAIFAKSHSDMIDKVSLCEKKEGVL